MKVSDSLTRRAGLTLISKFMLQGAHLVVGFVVTPIIIRGLGAELYGAWSMIRQSIGYLSLSDLKPMGTLKLQLSVRQHLEDVREKQRQIGSALLTWAITLPLFLTFGGLVIWKLPGFIHVAPEFFKSVQIAVAIVVVSVVMERLLGLPSNVLRGVNLEYKAMGVRAVIVLFNGGMIVFALWNGWGLPGVAGASVLGILISGLVRLCIARSVLPWFGVAMPKKREFIEFAKLSLWLTLLGLSKLLLTASDLLLVGFLLGPSAAGVYATTRAAMRIITDTLTQVFHAAHPGLIGICGQGDWKRMMKVRSEMFSLALACMILVGSGILALNKTFVSLWVGTQFFGGQLTTFFLVLTEINKVFFRIDSIVVGGMLEIKRMALSMFVSGSTVLALGFGLTSLWGGAGMACATFIGYLLQWLYYQWLIENHCGLSAKLFLLQFLKPVLIAFPVLLAASLSFQCIHLEAWSGFFLVMTLISAFMLSYVWFLLLGAYNRHVIISRLKSFI